MKIEVGKKYKNNVGEVVKITSYSEGYKFPYMDDNSHQYDREGYMPGYKSKYLVEEIDEYKELKNACVDMLNSWSETGSASSHMLKIENILNKQAGHIFDRRDNGNLFCKRCMIDYEERFNQKCILNAKI